MLFSPNAPPAGAPTGARAPVELVRWPADADRRASLAAAGRPRILLLAPGAPPPMTWDPIEDWVREPAASDEIEARAWALVNRAERSAVAPDGPGAAAGLPVAMPMPMLDADGLLRHAGAWVAVPTIEARMLALLLDRPGEVVRRTALVAAGWPAGVPSEHVLDGRIKLLRRRLAKLGFRIHTVRGVGFLLECPEPE